MGVCPLPPPVEALLQLNNGREAIAVEFTDERLSAHAGIAGFWSWLRGTGVIAELERRLPHPQPISHNHLTPLNKALTFLHGLWCGAEKLTQMAHLRRPDQVIAACAVQQEQGRAVAVNVPPIAAVRERAVP